MESFFIKNKNVYFCNKRNGMITRCYLEITNICNLDCLFCPKTDREKRRLTLDEFNLITDRLQGQIKFLYFHLMGEPLLHPLLPDFIRLSREKGFVPVLTTNGTLMARAKGVVEAKPHKVQISLHAHEGNKRDDLEAYIHDVMTFSQEAASRGTIVVLRLWNQGGYDCTNAHLLDLIARYQPQPWSARSDGWRLSSNLYIEYDRMFEWPDDEHDEYEVENVFCYALRNQIGVLVDGSVVPCCLDHAGSITLGNLFDQPLNTILDTPRAKALYHGFTKHTAVEPLCRRCGYIAITKQYRK